MSKPMNLLVVLTDQQSADALSHVGNPYLHTPNLDRLASRSTCFSKAYCSFPKCVPSRTSLFYGRMPHQIMLPGTELDYGAKVGDPKRGVRPEFRAEEMGHWFTRAGYDCVYGGKWHVGQWGPTESLEPEFGSGFRALCRINDPQVPRACAEYFRSRGDRPFLMVASFDNPHNICEWAWEEPLPWGDLPEAPPRSELPPFPGNYYEMPDEPYPVRVMRARIAERQNRDPEGWRRYRWAYYRLVEKVDAEIGRLLQGLESAGLADSTAILFTSDHGDQQGAHGLSQKDVLYEEAARVPLFLSVPGIAGPPRSPALASSGLDLYPTLCDLAGVTPPPGLPGRSLLPVVRGETPDRPYVAAEQKYLMNLGEARMIRTARFKYICHSIGPDREQLFDLEADPGEMTNLAGCAVFREELQRHREYLRDWMTRTEDPLGTPHYCHPGVRLAIPGDAYPVSPG